VAAARGTRSRPGSMWLDDFESLGWADYATLARRGTGGWATTEALFAGRCLLDAASGGLAGRRSGHVPGHEAQHFADLRLFERRLELEASYSAKLVELATRDARASRLIISSPRPGHDTTHLMPMHSGASGVGSRPPLDLPLADLRRAATGVAPRGLCREAGRLIAELSGNQSGELPLQRFAYSTLRAASACRSTDEAPPRRRCLPASSRSRSGRGPPASEARKRLLTAAREARQSCPSGSSRAAPHDRAGATAYAAAAAIVACRPARSRCC